MDGFGLIGLGLADWVGLIGLGWFWGSRALPGLGRVAHCPGSCQLDGPGRGSDAPVGFRPGRRMWPCSFRRYTLPP